jgi:hypothetical protein
MNCASKREQLLGRPTLLVTWCHFSAGPVRRDGGLPEGSNMTAGKWVIAAALALGLLPRVAAAEYWRYETDSGSTAFTDDAKNIPAKYRASAVKIAEEPLTTYKRLSIVEPVQPTPSRVAPEAAAVPVFPWPVGSAAQAPAGENHPSDRIAIDVEGVRIDVDPNSEEPIYIDKQQYTDANGDYIDHGGYMAPTTIVRRGDKPLVYIDER